MESSPPLQAETLPLPALNARRRQAVALRLEGHTLQQAAQASGLSVPTVVDAHMIFVMDAGRIIERGTHAELLQAQGRYAQMWALQQSGD